MAAAGRGREQDSARFVYVTRFGSHQCGGVLQLGGRGAQGLWGQGPGAACRQEKPREAMAVADVQSSSELPLGSQLRVPTTPGVEAAASASSQLRASRVQSCTRQSARAGGAAGRGGAGPGAAGRDGAERAQLLGAILRHAGGWGQLSCQAVLRARAGAKEKPSNSLQRASCGRQGHLT